MAASSPPAPIARPMAVLSASSAQAAKPSRTLGEIKRDAVPAEPGDEFLPRLHGEGERFGPVEGPALAQEIHHHEGIPDLDDVAPVIAPSVGDRGLHTSPLVREEGADHRLDLV